jgi:hypothetical protein
MRRRAGVVPVGNQRAIRLAFIIRTRILDRLSGSDSWTGWNLAHAFGGETGRNLVGMMSEIA